MERYEEIERSIIKTYRKSIWRKFIKCINEYSMMNEGDKIAVCVSGSAKSMLLAKCAQEIHRHGVAAFELCFISADAEPGGHRRKALADNAKALNIPLEIFEADGCDISSLLRKARSMGCGKIALGDSFDDAVEAILANMLKGGFAAALMPKEKSADYGLEIIRPLEGVKERDINAWAKRCGLRFLETDEKNPDMRALLERLRKINPYIEKNIMGSMRDVNLSTLIGYHEGDRAYNFLDDYEKRGKGNV